jgi:hypothetical protein
MTLRVMKINVGAIRKCPHLIIVPNHYRANGTCRCNDPEHEQMAGWGYRWNGKEWI